MSAQMNTDATSNTKEAQITVEPQPTDNKDSVNNDLITLIKPGIQVCTLEFDILPVVGTLYVVNNDHNLIKVIYEPDQVYQTDSNGTLHRIGIQKKKKA
jgi:hypothetical protein